MTIRHVLAGLTVSATLLLGACGDDDDNGDDSASTEAPSDSGEATGDAAVTSSTREAYCEQRFHIPRRSATR